MHRQSKKVIGIYGIKINGHQGKKHFKRYEGQGMGPVWNQFNRWAKQRYKGAEPKLNKNAFGFMVWVDRLDQEIEIFEIPQPQEA